MRRISHTTEKLPKPRGESALAPLVISKADTIHGIEVRRNCDLIPIPYTVITRVNTLGGNQPKIITFIDRNRRLIGDLETPGMGEDSDEREVEFPEVDIELEEEEIEMSYIESEGNFKLLGVDMEGKYNPHKSLILMIPTSHKK